MNIAVIGCGNHFKKKIYNIFKKNLNLNIVGIVTSKISENKSILKNEKFFNSVDELPNVIDVVYINTSNNYHFKNIKYFLKKNINVICEKPAFLNFDELKIIEKIILKNKALFFEVDMFIHSKQFSFLKKFYKKKISKIKRIKTSFTFPLPDSKNIRLNKKKGGGAYYDAAYYPISLLSNLIGELNIKKSNIKYQLFFRKNVLINGNIDLKLNELNINFDYGFDLPYSNYCEFYDDKQCILNSKFIYSKPINYKSSIKFLYNDSPLYRYFYNDNQFEQMFKKYIFFDTKKSNYINYLLTLKTRYRNFFKVWSLINE